MNVNAAAFSASTKDFNPMSAQPFIPPSQNNFNATATAFTPNSFATPSYPQQTQPMQYGFNQ